MSDPEQELEGLGEPEGGIAGAKCLITVFENDDRNDGRVSGLIGHSPRYQQSPTVNRHSWRAKRKWLAA
jgi:hypothetical protein